MNLARWWRNRKRAKRIQSYQDIPGLLEALNTRKRELVVRAAANPPFPPDVMQQKLNAVSEECIKAMFPEIWPDIEKSAAETGMAVGDVASMVMHEVIIPEMLSAGEAMLAKQLEEIKAYCQAETNRELDAMNAETSFTKPRSKTRA